MTALLLALAAPRLLALDGFVLGEHRNGKWSAISSANARLTGAGTLAWTPAPFGRETGAPVAARVATETEGYVGLYVATSGTLPGVLLSGAKPRRPRPVELLPAGDATYRAILRRWLDAHGLRRSPARIVRIARADLDGDGTKEVLIEARSREGLPQVGFETPSNTVDYSVVLLRAIRGKGVVETALRFSRGNGPQGTSDESKLRAIADLDGDGRMDVVLSWRAWEAFGGELWHYRAGRATQVLENGSAI